MGPNGDMQKGINAVESISLGMEWLRGASLGGLVVKNSPALHELQEMQVQFLGWDDPLEKEMETHSSILAWKIPWLEITPTSSLGNHWLSVKGFKRDN